MRAEDVMVQDRSFDPENHLDITTTGLIRVDPRASVSNVSDSIEGRAR